MITVIETPCFPCQFTVSKDGKTPLSNGDFNLWFKTKEKAQRKADELNKKEN